jgi:hypothetical protein
MRPTVSTLVRARSSRIPARRGAAMAREGADLAVVAAFPYNRKAADSPAKGIREVRCPGNVTW